MTGLGTLLAFRENAIDPNTSFTESEIVITTHNPAVQTAVGVTLTLLGQDVIEANPSNLPSLAFPGIIRDSLYRIGYRRASTHGYDPNGRVVGKTSSDGVTWSAESTLLDTPGIDDRDCQFWTWDGQLNLGTYWYTGTDPVTGGMQAFVRRGGQSVNIAGFPLSGLAKECTNRPLGYDVERYILNGGQWPFGSIGSWRRAGFVNRSVGHIAWLRSNVYQLDESGIARINGTTLVIAERGQDANYANAALLVTRTADNGASFEGFQVFPFAVGAPNLLLHSSGLLLCAFREYAGANVYTSIIYSQDDGLTWSAAWRFYSAVAGDSGYPTMIEGSNGDVLVTWYESGTIYLGRVGIS